jgi:cytochrome c biogenesis factor
VVPDTFKDDSEVVLTGRLTSEGFKATDMTAKCPSKYEAAAPPLGAPTKVESEEWHPSVTTCCWQLSSSVPYAAAISVGGARRRSRALIESGVGAFYLVTAIMSAASAVIVYAFVTGDYSIKYVQRYSDSTQPLFYKLTSYWGGLDGSIMFWVSLLSVFGAIAVYVNRERHRELIPYVVAVISVVEMFFLFLMIVHNNPFSTYLTQNPTDGAGLNPLLQNFYMVIPPADDVFGVSSASPFRTHSAWPR